MKQQNENNASRDSDSDNDECSANPTHYANTAALHALESHFEGINIPDDDSDEELFFTNYVASHTGLEVKTIHTRSKQKGKPKKFSKSQTDQTIVDATDIHIGDLVRPMKKKGRPGFCCDIGAPRSVIEQKELHRVMNRLQRHKFPMQKSNRSFRFADTTYSSLGQIELPLATPPGIPLVYVTLDIVSADIPALLGLEVLDGESLMVGTVTNRLWKRVITSSEIEPLTYVDLWHVPLTRYDGHVYTAMSFPSNVFFTRTKHSKLHRQFMHPSASSLFNLPRRARPEDLPPGHSFHARRHWETLRSV